MTREAGPYDSHNWEVGVFFPESARAQIDGLVRFNRKKFGVTHTVEGKIFEAYAIGQSIPQYVLQSVWMRLSRDGFAFVFGLPDDPEVAEVVHLALSIRSGFDGVPFNYKEQNGGDIVMKLTPKKGSAENTNTTPGEFRYHADDSIVDPEFRTKYIALYGVVAASGAWTYYAPLDPVWRSLSSSDINICCSARFQVKMPTSFGRDEDIWSEPRPIFFVRGNGERCVAFPTYNVRVADENDREAEAALERVIAAFNQCQNYVSLDPGTFLIFDNDRGLHKRTAITGDRLVLRTYIRPNLDAMRCKTNSNGFIFSIKDLGL